MRSSDERFPRGAGLPAPLTELIGRDDAITVGCELLTRSRLVTLTGPGGIGKTQLAQAIARRLDVHFADGVAFVELATVIGHDLVVSAIATTLGLRGTSSEPIDERLKSFLREQHVLLVLDNAEHLLEATPQISELLVACARLHILVTSRSPLRLRSEHEFDVPPLATPPLGHGLRHEELTRYPAIELFVRQAQATDATFALTERNAVTISAICSRLGGMPLAIELAAARIRVLSPGGILARLDEQLLLLIGGPRDQPARLQTMRNAIAWSYGLLDAGQQTLFRRLAVFSGGWTLDAAEAICQPDEEILEAMSSLVACSLVRKTADQTGEARFVVLEPIRQFALEQLVQSGEIDAVCSRHADAFLALAEQAAPHLDWSDQPVWTNRLEPEHDNFLIALSWLLDQRDTERGLRFIGALSWFWNMRGFFVEGSKRAHAFLNLPHANRRTAAYARALGAAAHFQFFLGDYEQAQALGEEALAISDASGDRACRGRILIPLITTAAETADHRLHLQRSEELLTVARELGDRENITRALTHLGDGALRDGDAERALALVVESLALVRQLGQPGSIALALGTLGDVYRQTGDLARAAEAYRESLAIYVDIDFRWTVARGFERLATLACARGQLQRSTRLYAAAALRRTAIGSVVLPSKRVNYDNDLAAIRAGLTDEQFQSAWDSGHSMSFDAAIAYALEADPAPAPAQPSAAGNLSPRERDVLRLIAAGQSNKEIAADLFLSVRTVERHITNLYVKIGARGRGDATAWALRHDLG